MKKVKFTLGWMLSMLFLGAGVGNAQDYDKTYPGPFTEENERSFGWIYVTKSESYSDVGYAFYGISRDDPEKKKEYRINSSSLLSPGLDINKYSYVIDAGSYSSSGSMIFSSDKMREDWITDLYNSLKLENKGYKFYQEITVKLDYKDGKEIYPFVRRVIGTGDRKTIIVQDLLLAYDVTDKTKFTNGTGIATYKYKIDITPLLGKYDIDYIDYYIWTGDEVSDDPGSANSYPTIPRAVTVYAEDGITTSPVSGMTTYVDAYKDFTFDVYGDPGKELVVTTSNPNYATGGKGITITPDGVGKWKVKITRVYLALNIYVGYAVTDQSTNANATLNKDAVWTAGGQLYIQSATPAKLEVYSITGQLQKANVVNGSITLSDLPKGIYLVKLNGKTYKVIN
jgi:hypothetical protein